MKINHYLAVTLGLFISSSAMAKTQKATLINPTIACKSKKDAENLSVLVNTLWMKSEMRESIDNIFHTVKSQTGIFNECHLFPSKITAIKVFKRNKGVHISKLYPDGLPMRYAQFSIRSIGGKTDKRIQGWKLWTAYPYAKGAEILKLNNGKKW